MIGLRIRNFKLQLRRKLLNRRIPCLLCGSRKSSFLYRSPNVGMPVFRDIFAEKVERCDDCGFVYTTPRMSAKHLERYYNDDYLLEGLRVPQSLEEFLSEPYREIWFTKDRDLNLVLQAKSAGRLLDVGCASGTLLWLAKRKGFSVAGVDVSRGAAEFARTILDIDVFRGQLIAAHFPDRAFDVITMIHSLEHVPDPRGVLKEIHRLLADDGALIIVVPNFASWSSRKDHAQWKWLQPQNHYSHFTPQTLARMVEAEGFQAAVSTEEGRYGEEEIRKQFSTEEIPGVHRQLQGSEIVLLGRKQSIGSQTQSTARVSAFAGSS